MMPYQEKRNRILILVNSYVHIIYGLSTMILVTFAVDLIKYEICNFNYMWKGCETKIIIDIQSSYYSTCSFVMMILNLLLVYQSSYKANQINLLNIDKFIIIDKNKKSYLKYHKT